MAEGFKGSDHPETKPLDSPGGEEMETEENVESSSSGTSEGRSERSIRTSDSGDSNQASAPSVSEKIEASTSSEESKPISQRTISKSVEYKRLGNVSGSSQKEASTVAKGSPTASGGKQKSKNVFQKISEMTWFKGSDHPETKPRDSQRGEEMETEGNVKSSSSGTSERRSKRSFRTSDSGDSNQASAPPVSEKIKAATSSDESKPISQRTRSKSIDLKRQSNVSGSPLKEASAVAKGSPTASGGKQKSKNVLQKAAEGFVNLITGKISRKSDEAKQSLPQSELILSEDSASDTGGSSTEVGEASQPEARRKPPHYDITGQEDEFLGGSLGGISISTESEGMITDTTSIAASISLCDREDPSQSDPGSQVSSPKEMTAKCKILEKELDHPRSSKSSSGKGLKRTKSIPEETDDEMACSSPSKRPEMQDPDQGNSKDS